VAAFPFLRESIFTTATRLGATAPVLGLLRAGQFRVGPAPDLTWLIRLVRDFGLGGPCGVVAGGT